MRPTGGFVPAIRENLLIAGHTSSRASTLIFAVDADRSVATLAALQLR